MCAFQNILVVHIVALLVAARVGCHQFACVQPNIEKKDSPEDWRYREAATFAFGSILEGPSYQSLAGVTNAGLGFLLNATKDPNPMVRQTTAWTLGELVLWQRAAPAAWQVVQCT